MQIYPTAHQNSHETTGKFITKKPPGKTRRVTAWEGRNNCKGIVELLGKMSKDIQNRRNLGHSFDSFIKNKTIS